MPTDQYGNPVPEDLIVLSWSYVDSAWPLYQNGEQPLANEALLEGPKE